MILYSISELGYILENMEKNFIYVEYTNELKRRFKEHAEGKTQSTKSYRPLTLSTYVAVTTEEKAKNL